ncbi:hypothetical protein [Natronococcus sp.]|uniref:hypothetical protein n=1 Tax=Natronococcus sp. TaxID=35747 RepID=UPI003A4D61B4
MSKTEFHWGTVTHETEPKTGETSVEITVESEDSVSVATIAAPDATNDFFDGNDPGDGKRDAEVKTFQWGAVIHATDSDAGVTDVEVIVDAKDDVDLSVTTTSGGARSASTSTVRTDDFGDRTASDASATVSRSTSSTSQSTTSSTSLTRSTNVSQSSSVSQSSTTSSGDDRDDPTSIPIDDADDEDE